MKTAAFVTYNVMSGNIASGWHEAEGRRALVLQNTRGDGRWGNPIGATERARQSLTLWEQLQESLPSLDHVVVYVGTNGSEAAILLAAKLPAHKVTFVGCDCGLGFKKTLVAKAGMSRSRWIDCACGGHGMMRKLFDSFLATGELVPAEQLELEI